MSTVEIECRDAQCPKCGALASEHFERYLEPGELAFFGICYCDVKPVYMPVHAYQAVCDRCGEHVKDYGECSAIGPTPGAMWEYLPDWEHIEGRDLCPCCWHYNDNDEIKEVDA